jgi:DNA-damage-inducible protein J
MGVKTKTVSLRIDEQLYQQFVEFSEKVYIPPSALFSAFAAKTVNEQRIPFELAVDSFYSASNQKRLLDSVAQLEAGKGTAHDLIEE